ncbi:hypothetical protein [Streptomyces tricolor]
MDILGQLLGGVTGAHGVDTAQQVTDLGQPAVHAAGFDFFNV